MAIEITDPDDARIAGYRHIRERDLVGRDGRFIAEGEVVLRVLMGSALCQPVSVLIDAKRQASLAPFLGRLPAKIPVYVAGQAVIDAIAGFHLHRGILALAERSVTPGAAELIAGLPAKAVVVCLFGIGNHDNMGGLFRNAAAFGADAVLIDAECCDPLYRKAIRVSVGAALITPFARLGRAEDALGMLEAAGFQILALSPAGEVSLGEVEPAQRVAVLLGAEGPGLPANILARTTTVRIPIETGFDSLNVATTSGIVLHHLRAAS
ncbi:RNA methyltransferase [soil metagenome]